MYYILAKHLCTSFAMIILNQKYGDKVKLCYMDTDSFIFIVETVDFFKDISNDVIEWFDTSDDNKDDRLPTRINKKMIGKFKDEMKGKLMTKFVTLASKVYAYLDDNDNKHRKVKGINKCVRDKVLRFNQCMDAFLLNKTIRAIQQRFKSDHHTITTEEVNKIALSRKDDKRIQSFDGITTYPIGIDNDLFNELETEIKNKPTQLYY